MKTALVTGASGGLGGAMTRALSGAGWGVAAGYRSQKPAESESVCPIQIDVTDSSSVAKAVTQTVARWGRLDAVVHCAGENRDRSLARMTVEDWDFVMDSHLKSAFLLCREALPAMARSNGGSIVLVGSFAAIEGRAGLANYCAAKAALIGFGKSLAKEVAPENIRVNLILPGVMPTRMAQSMSDQQLKNLEQANVLNRLNDPAEVSAFILGLIESNDISGQVFQLDSRIASWT